MCPSVGTSLTVDKERVTVPQAKKAYTNPLLMACGQRLSGIAKGDPRGVAALRAGKSAIPTGYASVRLLQSVATGSSVSLAAQERWNIQQILRVRLGPQPVTNRSLPLDRGLIQGRVVAVRQRSAPNHAHGRLTA